ncbi:hypothetical protein Cob_v004187 [Colletotrichum orbiculare MAFF 240422]|uniref:SMODS and SLOG-associating 2TM effector domain-containing protein n=1 Tax=Colletotrichum orbiculare (strain 104-T / ATCC 96160 / CBS 514.97 / LARS 414 / MAFF 240422) TaxID=1213857 RepID=N4VAN9_COLOR|nr:hypothetical protein Cob_v004187 [Colletotrichum orbiculare MAFF 240422]
MSTIRALPPLQLDGIEAEREAEREAEKQAEVEHQKNGRGTGKDKDKETSRDASFKGMSNLFKSNSPGESKKRKKRVRHRFLTPTEWAIFAHGIGGVSDTEGHLALHPFCWYYPPKGIPNGLYRDVIWHRTKYFYFYHGMSTIRWVCYILQIVIGAVITAISGMSFKDGTPITVLAAINTVNAGILALLHNSGLPDRYRSDQSEFEKVEDHLKMILDTGIVPQDMTVDQVLVDCFDLYSEAKTTIQANIPAVYTPSSVRQNGQQVPELGQSDTPGQATPPNPRNSIIGSRIMASGSMPAVAPDVQEEGK